MKRLAMILISLTMAAMIGASETSDKMISTAQTMYIQGIKKGNIGLRSDAIFRIAELKSNYPDMPTKHVSKTLQKAVQEDANPLVRTYAGLTLIYLSEASINRQVKVLPRETSIAFFQRLQKEIYTKTLAVNSQ